MRKILITSLIVAPIFYCLGVIVGTLMYPVVAADLEALSVVQDLELLESEKYDVLISAKKALLDVNILDIYERRNNPHRLLFSPWNPIGEYSLHQVADYLNSYPVENMVAGGKYCPNCTDEAKSNLGQLALHYENLEEAKQFIMKEYSK